MGGRHAGLDLFFSIVTGIEAKGDLIISLCGTVSAHLSPSP